jgi:hypothetical protein
METINNHKNNLVFLGLRVVGVLYFIFFKFLFFIYFFNLLFFVVYIIFRYNNYCVINNFF